jgi:hypothetical protein
MVILTAMASEILTRWADSNPGAHNAALKLVRQIRNNPNLGVPASAIMHIKPGELKRFRPSIRSLWQLLRLLPADIRNSSLQYSDLLLRRQRVTSSKVSSQEAVI